MNQLSFGEEFELGRSGLVVFVWDFLLGGASERVCQTRDAVGISQGGFTFASWLGFGRDPRSLRSVAGGHSGGVLEERPAEDVVRQREPRRDELHFGQAADSELCQASLASQRVDAFGG